MPDSLLKAFKTKYHLGGHSKCLKFRKNKGKNS